MRSQGARGWRRCRSRSCLGVRFAVSRALHADALVSNPRPILPSLPNGGLIDSPDARVDTFAACGRVRPPGDFPLAGIAGESVADLKVHRKDMVGEKPDLMPRALGPDAGGYLPQGLP